MLDEEMKELIKLAKSLEKGFEVRLKYNEEVKAENDEFVLDSININAAFFPAVWGCLNAKQKLAAVMIAGKWHKIKINKFCFEPRLYYEIFVYDGKNLCFNLSSLGNILIDSVDFLAEILNYPVQKSAFKFKQRANEKNRITDFDSFEELEYVVNLKISEDAENINDLTKAIYLDQKLLKNYRNSKILALNFVLDYANEIDSDEIKQNYNEQLQRLIGENEFIYSVLGYNLLIRDLAFLRVANNLLGIGEEKMSIVDAAKHFESHFGNDIVLMLEEENLQY